MGKTQDLKAQVYGEFIKWLDNVGIGDVFSMDVWASKLFDLLHQQYQQDMQHRKLLSQASPQVLAQMTVEQVQELLKAKQADAAKASAPTEHLAMGNREVDVDKTTEDKASS